MGSYIIRNIENSINIKILESLDIANSSSFKIDFENRFSEETTSVVIDLRDCSYIDSSGIAAFLYINKISIRNAFNLVFKNMPNNIYRVIELANLVGVLKISESELFSSANAIENNHNNIKNLDLEKIFNP